MDYASPWATAQPPPPPAAAVAQHPSAAHLYAVPDQSATHNVYHAPQLQEHYAASLPYDASAQTAQYSAAYTYDAPPAHHQLNLHHPAAPSDPQYYYHSAASAPNPNPSSVSGAGAAVESPGHEPYPHGWYEGFLAAAHLYQQAAAADGAGGQASYYGAEGAQSSALKAAIRQYGVDPSYYGSGAGRSSSGPEPTAFTHRRPAYPNTNLKKPFFKNAVKKVSKGKPKQTAFCEVCKIDCTTQEVLMSHKQGKKHKKNLQKLQESITPKPPKGPATMTQKDDPTGDKGKAVGEKSRKRTVPATAEELEEKKRRILEGGAAAEGVRVCTICNVVVNSQQVFEYHVAGQMHAAMVKKQQAMRQAAPVP